MRKKTVLQEVVYPPYGLPETFIDWAIQEVRNKRYMCFVAFEKVAIEEHIRVTLRLEVFGDGLLDENRLKTTAEDLRKELQAVNKVHHFFKEVYGLEPKKSWWDKIRRK